MKDMMFEYNSMGEGIFKNTLNAQVLFRDGVDHPTLYIYIYIKTREL